MTAPHIRSAPRLAPRDGATRRAGLLAWLTLLSVTACSELESPSSTENARDDTPASEPTVDPGSSHGDTAAPSEPLPDGNGDGGAGEPGAQTDAAPIDSTRGADGKRDIWARALPFEAKTATPNIIYLPDHIFALGVTGDNCLDCHTAGGRASAKPWAAAGTVYEDATASAGAAGVEVRIVSVSGAALGKAYTDPNGNFWFPATIGAVAGAVVGVRDANGSRTMQTLLRDGACTSCHSGPTTPRIALKP